MFRLGGPIPITDMNIHKITHLSHEGLNLDKEFGRNTGEKELVERMKQDYELVKKLRENSIFSISDLEFQLDA